MTYVDLRFTDARGREQVVYATMRNSGVWDVRGIVAGDPFSRACDRWQAVERTVFWLRRHAHESAPTCDDPRLCVAPEKIHGTVNIPPPPA